MRGSLLTIKEDYNTSMQQMVLEKVMEFIPACVVTVLLSQSSYMTVKWSLNTGDLYTFLTKQSLVKNNMHAGCP